MDFGKDVVVVTGAGNGMGRQHALLLARLGARVVVNDIGVSLTGTSDNDSPGEAVVREIVEAGGEAVLDTHSVATADGAQAIVQTALDSFGAIHAIVNNAGFLRDRSFAKMTEDDFDKVIEVHLKASFLTSAAVWPHFKEQGYGRIVTTTSGAGLYGNFGQTNYSAAKLGLVGLTKTLAIEGAKNDIKANVLSPAAATRMSNDVMDEESRRLLRPELVSPVVAVLAHRECPWTGEVIAAGGGRVARAYIGETAGYVSADLTPEGILANQKQIFDTKSHIVPASVGEEAEFLVDVLRAAGL